ncbi:MAG: Gfo/Idh/MocA family oxidoreductase [Planctomycetales bacterium]|nr:Gfo/Idh/MocA family oxidoreductase [Planctomycetales bacterium]
MPSRIRRRDFVKVGAAFAALGVLPSRARAVSANGKLRTAHIGVGGMGGSDLGSIASHAEVEIAALCDVDAQRLAEAHAKHPLAKTFHDFREMLDSLGDQVDAVVVSTPDHTHAPAAMSALNLGKPVYCQKPLTHEAFEARRLHEVSRQKNLVTQMGIQVHSSAPYRRAVQIIQSGAIGRVKEVHAWSNKNWGYDGSFFENEQPAPDTLAWDLWLGTAQERPFTPGVYHPGQWRKLIDFGTGTLGDMGVHIFDTPYAACKLTAPNWVETSCRTPTGIGHPEKNKVVYEFPGTDVTTDTLRWTWYDGQFAPPEKAAWNLPEDLSLPGQGALFLGEEGTMLLPHVAEASLYPSEKFASYERPQVEDGNHYHQWVDACLGEGTTSAPFSYGGPLTEALLLGVIAARFPKTRLMWNAEHMRFTNVADANRFVRREYRSGYQVEGLS